MITATLLDVCLPCYFQGSLCVYLQIPVWVGMTLDDVESTASRAASDLLDTFGVPSDVTDHDIACAIRAEVTRCKVDYLTLYLEPTLDDFDDGETVYAYFRIDF